MVMVLIGMAVRRDPCSGGGVEGDLKYTRREGTRKEE